MEHLDTLVTADLVRHEGYKEEIYLDSVGEKTFGIGHLVTPKDDEWAKPVGARVGSDRIAEAFKGDLRIAYFIAYGIFDGLADRPLEVQRVLINMAFNLGGPRLRKFKKMIAAYEAEDYITMADEMQDSKWFRQVGSRGRELVARIRKLGET